MIEFGLQSTGSGIWDPEVSQPFKASALSSAKDDETAFTLTEENGLTTENFVYIDNAYQYTWSYANETGETLSILSIENEIPDELNWQTFAPIASSHNANTVISSIQGYTVLEVEHVGIALEDESMGEEESTLLFSYSIKANNEEPHLQEVMNAAVLQLEEDIEISSNSTENKVYTCEGLEEVMSLSLLDQCSPGAIGFTAIENELETEYTVNYNGSVIPFDEWEISEQSGDTIVYGFTAYVGEEETEVVASNIFGCQSAINEVFEIDTIAEMAIGTLLEAPICFEEYELYGISDIDVSFEWLFQPQGEENLTLVSMLDTLNADESGMYYLYPSSINPACRDTATLEVELLYVGFDDGFVPISPSPFCGICLVRLIRTQRISTCIRFRQTTKSLSISVISLQSVRPFPYTTCSARHME